MLLLRMSQKEMPGSGTHKNRCFLQVDLDPGVARSFQTVLKPCACNHQWHQRIQYQVGFPQLLGHQTIVHPPEAQNPGLWGPS